ncbi:vacuolar DHA amino acid exporter [Mycena leptocephala]|nr:vacuolar DHA amino acid exporter [Mycena leptocephala]
MSTPSPAASDMTHSDPPLHETFDIEHMPVEDDPRAWSTVRKNIVLALVASASMIAGLASNIQNPAIADMEVELSATASQISLSLSLFIAFQGVMPLVWSAISEVKGRKFVYVVSIAIFAAGSVVVATSKTIELVIIFRCIQATGYVEFRAATLADIFEPAERGTKMGIYYMAPLLGPSLAPIMGGALTTVFNWRAPFWFLAVVSGLSCTSILLFLKDTFRKERSLAYQSVLKSRLKSRVVSLDTICTVTVVEKEPPVPAEPSLPVDLEKQRLNLPVIKLTLRDVNPFTPLWLILRRINNLVILFASGLMFAFNFVVPFTASRTLSSAYGYDAFEVGLVLLSFGLGMLLTPSCLPPLIGPNLGSLAGSLLGGRWSDRKLASLKAANGGVGYPEHDLGTLSLAALSARFGWVSEQHVHVSAICVFLFLAGFFVIWAYTSTLAYIVDANNGRSSTVVATNSAFRGISACIFIELAVPLQDSLGDGWHYTMWAGLLIFTGGLVWLVVRKGGAWREAAEAREQRAANK